MNSHDATKFVDQDMVTEFYDQLVFPSKISIPRYEALVPPDLQGKRVGDFGCGQSLFIEVFRRLEYDAVFLDISQNVIDLIDDGEKICASLTEIPISGNSMDAIFCIGVVHHIPEMEKAKSEIIRVLRPGGILKIGVYAPNTISAFLKRKYDRCRTNIGRKNIERVTRLLMRYKERGNAVSKEDLQKRVDDLLVTPLVRYMSAEEYSTIIGRFGGRVAKIDRLFQMNVLTVSKPGKP